MAGQPKTPFFIVLVLVVLGLILFAVMNSDLFAPEGGDGGGDIDPSKIGAGGVEAPDSQGITTLKEYKYVPAQRLPPVKGTSAYTPLSKTDPIVKFALKVWAGCAII